MTEQPRQAATHVFAANDRDNLMIDIFLAGAACGVYSTLRSNDAPVEQANQQARAFIEKIDADPLHVENVRREIHGAVVRHVHKTGRCEHAQQPAEQGEGTGA